MSPEEKSMKRFREILAADAEAISAGFAQMEYDDFIKAIQLPVELKVETA